MGYSAAIGQCSAIASPLHRVDARAKTACFIAFSMLSFFINDVPSAVFVAAMAIVLIAASRIPLRTFWHAMRPFTVLLVFSLVVNMLVIRGGAVLAIWGPVVITSRGVEMGVIIAYRTLAALAFGVLLVGTTTPVELCSALESLLKPLRVFGVPYQDVAMIFSIALRYIPLLADEAQQMVSAQKSRGAAAFNGPLAKRAKLYASMAVPLLSSSLRHAERLAVALEARCWAAEDVRTHLLVRGFRPSDAGFTIAMVAAVSVFCLLAAM